MFVTNGASLRVFRNTHKRWKKILVKHKAPENGYIYSAFHERTADLARMENRYGEAIEHLQKTLEIFENTYGKDSRLLVAKLSNLAQVYLDKVSCCVRLVRFDRFYICKYGEG